MAKYEILPDDSSLLKEGTYKFLVVSKTENMDDALIIFGDAKTRHFVLLHYWMQDNNLAEAYTFGGGKMSVSHEGRGWYLHIFGVSTDYDFAPKELVRKILQKRGLLIGVTCDLDLSDQIKENARLSFF